VRNGCDIFVRIALIMRVVRDAAALDAEMAAQWRTNEEQRLFAFLLLSQLLADGDVLKPGLSVDEANDILFALNSVGVSPLLTTSRGWTPARWERWLVTTLVASLLR